MCPESSDVCPIWLPYFYVTRFMLVSSEVATPEKDKTTIGRHNARLSHSGFCGEGNGSLPCCVFINPNGVTDHKHRIASGEKCHGLNCVGRAFDQRSHL